MILNLLIAYLVIGFIVALYGVGYYRRDWGDGRTNKREIVANILTNSAFWPVAVLIAAGEVLRDRAERTERMRREHDEAKARVEESLRRGRRP